MALVKFDLSTILPELLPRAIAWAEIQQAQIMQTGQPLDETQLALAKSVGVLHPEVIHIAVVPCIPLPESSELREAALATGLIGPSTAGITLGYGIYIRRNQVNSRLLSHEFRHVYQYEQAGSIADFLPTYLEQIANVGYEKAPLELDARAHEKMSFN